MCMSGRAQWELLLLLRNGPFLWCWVASNGILNREHVLFSHSELTALPLHAGVDI